MGVMFHFERLLNKYSVDCQLICMAKEGSYVAGDWIPSKSPEVESISGALIPVSERKVYQSGGSYTDQDREFITAKKISMESESHILHGDEKYQVQGSVNYFEYAGFYKYDLKRVSAFDQSKTDESDNNRRT